MKRIKIHERVHSTQFKINRREEGGKSKNFYIQSKKLDCENTMASTSARHNARITDIKVNETHVSKSRGIVNRIRIHECVNSTQFKINRREEGGKSKKFYTQCNDTLK